MTGSHRRVAVIVAGALAALTAVVAAVIVATRGTDSATPPASATTAGPGTTAVGSFPASVGPLAPLTGRPIDQGVVTRPALVVKIDNAGDDARPQAGLEQADVVYEEKIEGPFSRFAAVFQSTGASVVGPVRSGRTTDLAIVGPLHHPLYAFSGANSTFLPQLRAGPLVDVGADTHPEAYERHEDRRAPDNLFTSTEALWALSPAGLPPPGLWPFRAEGSAPATVVGAHPATSVTYDWGLAGEPIEYRWDPAQRRWFRFFKGEPHRDVDGGQLSAENVVIQRVPYVDTGIRDVAGTPVPEAQLIGSGEATVLTGGQAVPVTWTKIDEAAITTYQDQAGQPVAFAPGRTTVVLLPDTSEARVT